MTVTLAFYKGTRAENPDAKLFDRLVTWWPKSRGRFSHAELATDQQAQDWCCWSSSFRDSGVRPKRINLASGRWVLVVLPHHPEQPAVAYFERHRGWWYDLPGIFGYVVPWLQQIRWWLYCSEAVAKALRAAALASELPLEWPTSDIPPSALFAWAKDQPGALVIEAPNSGEVMR